jgi:outer membrane protein assembly factor BamB
VYALDTATGRRRWVNFEADWVGSSPCIAPELGLLFIGTEFGLLKKRGGIMALDIQTGTKVWSVEMPAYTHSSPLYIPGTLLSPASVLIGSNDGVARLFNAKKGTLMWEFATGTPSEQEIRAGFSAYDIKDSFAYSPTLNAVYFGNHTGDFFALNKKTGEKMWQAKAEFAFWSRPTLLDTLAPKNLGHTFAERVIASSLDKHVYCWDAATGKELWKWHAGARVFCAPTMWDEPQKDGSSITRVLVGANTGRLTALDPETGKEVWFITVPERIVNAPVYNPKTQSLFVPTFANELYKFETSPSPSPPKK